MSSTSLGVALKHLNGEGPIEVMTRVPDFNIQEVEGPDGRKAEIPATTLVAFQALRFRELGDSDIWEFYVRREVEGAASFNYIYVAGTDVFMVRAYPKVV